MALWKKERENALLCSLSLSSAAMEFPHEKTLAACLPKTRPMLPLAPFSAPSRPPRSIENIEIFALSEQKTCRAGTFEASEGGTSQGKTEAACEATKVATTTTREGGRRISLSLPLFASYLSFVSEPSSCCSLCDVPLRQAGRKVLERSSAGLGKPASLLLLCRSGFFSSLDCFFLLLFLFFDSSPLPRRPFYLHHHPSSSTHRNESYT